MSEPTFSGVTVADAIGFVAGHRKKGCGCPCCGQYVKEYGRSIHTRMALVLVALHKHFLATPGLEWLHVSKFPANERFNSNGDYNYLRHWGLLEPHPQFVGHWRVTELGQQFLRGETRVPRKVFLFNNQRIGASDETISIQDALGSEFTYEALMAEAA
jgi:hypothetical protein